MSVLAHITSRTPPLVIIQPDPTRRRVLGMLDPISRCVLSRFLFTTFLSVCTVLVCLSSISPSLHLSFLVCDSTTTDHSVSHHHASLSKRMSSIHTCSYVPHHRAISSNLHLQICRDPPTPHSLMLLYIFCECELLHLLLLLHKKSISIA